jgi:hypothetical protein
MKTKTGFQRILKRDRMKNFAGIRQLHHSQKEDLQQNPYHAQKNRTKQMLKNTRAGPLNDPEKADF